MILITLFEKLRFQNINANIQDINMTAHTSKTNELKKGKHQRM